MYFSISILLAALPFLVSTRATRKARSDRPKVSRLYAVNTADSAIDGQPILAYEGNFCIGPPTESFNPSFNKACQHGGPASPDCPTNATEIVIAGDSQAALNNSAPGGESMYIDPFGVLKYANVWRNNSNIVPSNAYNRTGFGSKKESGNTYLTYDTPLRHRYWQACPIPVDQGRSCLQVQLAWIHYYYWDCFYFDIELFPTGGYASDDALKALHEYVPPQNNTLGYNNTQTHISTQTEINPQTNISKPLIEPRSWTNGPSDDGPDEWNNFVDSAWSPLVSAANTDLDGSPIVALDSSFYIGSKGQPPNASEIVVVNGQAGLNVDIPGGQLLYVSKTGEVKYTAPHAPTLPAGANSTGFWIEGALTNNSFENIRGNWLACPEQINGTIQYQLLVNISGEHPPMMKDIHLCWGINLGLAFAIHNATQLAYDAFKPYFDPVLPTKPTTNSSRPH